MNFPKITFSSNNIYLNFLLTCIIICSVPVLNVVKYLFFQENNGKNGNKFISLRYFQCRRKKSTFFYYVSSH